MGVQAARLHQEGALLLGLHAFGNDPKIDQPGHRDDGFQDALALARLTALHVQQLHVQLEHIAVEVLQHVERRVAAAEVVHVHREPGHAQLVHELRDNLVVLHVGALGDLDGEQLRVDPVLFHQPFEGIHHVDGVDIAPGHVDRYGNRRAPGIDPGAQGLAYLLPYMQVERRDQAIALEHGHESRRRYHTAIRMFPTGERL